MQQNYCNQDVYNTTYAYVLHFWNVKEWYERKYFRRLHLQIEKKELMID
jgi:hypothetical protein